MWSSQAEIICNLILFHLWSQVEMQKIMMVERKRVFIQLEAGWRTYQTFRQGEAAMDVVTMLIMTIKWYHHSFMIWCHMCVSMSGIIGCWRIHRLQQSCLNWNSCYWFKLLGRSWWFTNSSHQRSEGSLNQQQYYYDWYLFHFDSSSFHWCLHPGGRDDGNADCNCLFRYNSNNESWTQVVWSGMKHTRSYHAVSLVKLHQVIDYCEY